jgi:hypothetical protein
VLQVKSREATGHGHADADVAISLSDGGGTIHTAARITGKPASMGEGVTVSVRDALTKGFTESLARISSSLGSRIAGRADRRGRECHEAGRAGRGPSGRRHGRADAPRSPDLLRPRP